MAGWLQQEGRMAQLRGLLRRKRASGNGATAQAAVDAAAVARVAYELYEQRGRVDGHDLEDWLRAEAIVRQRAARKANGR